MPFNRRVISLDLPPRPLCRLLICKGDTCGNNPELPAQLLEDTWKEEELQSVVGMKISTCQDKCEHAGVARIVTESGSEWYGNLNREHFEALIVWARACKEAGKMLERPDSLKKNTFMP